jgi:hypothetical protein
MHCWTGAEAGARTAGGSQRQAGGSVVPEHTCSDNMFCMNYPLYLTKRSSSLQETTTIELLQVRPTI